MTIYEALRWLRDNGGSVGFPAEPDGRVWVYVDQTETKGDEGIQVYNIWGFNVNDDPVNGLVAAVVNLITRLDRVKRGEVTLQQLVDEQRGRPSKYGKGITR